MGPVVYARWVKTRARLVVAIAWASVAACGGPAAAPAADGRPAPVYDPTTGRLKELVSDRNKDGKPDMWAYMDGPQIERIEIDRNGDGRIDRWEHYGPLPAGAAANAAPPLVRAEEANGLDDRITRREFYVRGAIDRVEEDADSDGRADKWEQYKAGALARVDLDLQGKGFADRRLIYGPGGAVDAIEDDSDGDGRFVPVKPEAGREP
jgi:hypothetical protein